MIQGSVIDNEEVIKLYCGLKKGEKKIFKKNKKIYKKLNFRSYRTFSGSYDYPL